MLKKIYFPFIVLIELALIFFLSGPVLAASARSRTLVFSRLQFVFVLVLAIVSGTSNTKYRKTVIITLLFLYIVYVFIWGDFLKVKWLDAIKGQNSF